MRLIMANYTNLLVISQHAKLKWLKKHPFATNDVLMADVEVIAEFKNILTRYYY